jgi:hypothetical protein
MATRLDTALINQIVLRVPWEEGLEPGRVGDYLEIIDHDPASNCFYDPVELDDPYLLAEHGLSPSEGNPQFHQQMVYAVAMTTIANFEHDLGRQVLWAPQIERDRETRGLLRSEPVFRLRVYPHDLHEQNAYYSPEKKALFFGYFPSSLTDSGEDLTGGLVFSCLSQDVVAHKATHALLDGRRSVTGTCRCQTSLPTCSNGHGVASSATTRAWAMARMTRRSSMSSACAV